MIRLPAPSELTGLSGFEGRDAVPGSSTVDWSQAVSAAACAPQRSVSAVARPRDPMGTRRRRRSTAPPTTRGLVRPSPSIWGFTNGMSPVENLTELESPNHLRVVFVPKFCVQSASLGCRSISSPRPVPAHSIVNYSNLFLICRYRSTPKTSGYDPPAPHCSLVVPFARMLAIPRSPFGLPCEPPAGGEPRGDVSRYLEIRPARTLIATASSPAPSEYKR